MYKSQCDVNYNRSHGLNIYYLLFITLHLPKGGRQGTNGLCVVTKTNACKTVRCESVERRRGGLSDNFLVEAHLKLLGGWRSAGRMEGVRNVLR